MGRFRLAPMAIVVAIAFIGSSAFIAFAVLRVRDTSQIPMLSAGFAVLGLSFVAIALAAVIHLWRAAALARLGRAVGLGLIGGLAGLAAIGCFTATVVLALLWRSS